MIGKTEEPTEVVFNRQLMLLLLEFGWEGFSPKTERPVERMHSWLGVIGYSFKSAILTAAAGCSSDLRLAQQIAGHRSIQATKIYTKLAGIADAMKFSEKVIIPGLSQRFGIYDEEQSI